MSNRIPTPTMGEILMEEFMGPMNLSAYKLAQSIHVPTSRIQDILHNRRKISADTSIRLGRFFGVSDRFFLDMQNDIEIRELTEKLDGDITTIKPYTAVKKIQLSLISSKPAAKKAAPKNEVIIQSPMGGEITPAEILAKVGPVDQVYVRVDENKLYWVKGKESGFVEIWD